MSSSAVFEPCHGLVYEDLPLGWRMRTAGRTIRDHDVSMFVTAMGFNEPLFLDDRHAGLAVEQGSRLAPGALTLCLAEGLVMQTNTLHHTGVAFLGMQMEVHSPVFVGDTIEVDVEVTERRLTTKGDRGIVATSNTVLRDGDCVLSYRPVRMLRRRARA